MTPEDSDLLDIIQVADRLADAAREATLPFFRSTALVEHNKDDAGFDPVTDADRSAERAMREILSASRPQDSILGEEYGAFSGTSDLIWVLDPIDGTRGFISGTPTWGILIAVSNGNGPFYGVIDQPYIGERFTGGPDGAHFKGPHHEGRISTRPPRALSEATVFTTFPEVGSSEEGQAFHAVARRARLTRYGMDCYAYALLAAGQIDLVIEAGLQPYDIQAPIALVQAAGGIVTDWSGGHAHDGGRAVAAANAEIHAEALEILRSEMP